MGEKHLWFTVRRRHTLVHHIVIHQYDTMTERGIHYGGVLRCSQSAEDIFVIA
jgi:hypothetical protein